MWSLEWDAYKFAAQVFDSSNPIHYPISAAKRLSLIHLSDFKICSWTVDTDLKIGRCFLTWPLPKFLAGFAIPSEKQQISLVFLLLFTPSINQSLGYQSFKICGVRFEEKMRRHTMWYVSTIWYRTFRLKMKIIKVVTRVNFNKLFQEPVILV